MNRETKNPGRVQKQRRTRGILTLDSTDAAKVNGTDIDLGAAFSSGRMERYEQWSKASGQPTHALYQLNTMLSKELYVALQTVEVALRTHMHRAAAGVHGERWVITPASFLDGAQRARIAKVKRRLSYKAALTPDDVVAGLSLEFWTTLFGRAYDPEWRSTFHRTFRKAARTADGQKLTRADVARSLDMLRSLRNRIAHHEPILHRPLADAYGNCETMLDWLSVDARAWLHKVCNFQAIFHPNSTLLMSLSGKR